MGKTIADTIGDIEIEKVQGPIDAKSIQIKSLWENQVQCQEIMFRLLVFCKEFSHT